MTHLFPGSGITPVSVLDTELAWWLRFAGAAKSHARAVEEQDRQNRLNRRG